ncbi:3-oxo-5-alpha-steroid 4-dehydrogenase 2-like protein [Labeo rohita]|uniref:3-oxo-5-alpha-steroid 4-dehydrogenase 2-like protein n=1 Tax=Labeo rohita TaxID=84645 RepID=A0A498LMQ5_LABRO|nr:3-oxo-5-alpha-steroid 4-dehydrogenase 2-like protein [Labeo rohita]
MLAYSKAYQSITFSANISCLLVFFTGMAINIHSDYILRNLRKPGEVSYKIPRGGLFELVSGANFFGEIVEWCGYAVACWSFPASSFALFTICSIGPRAYHHHRYYLEKFKDYPKSRKAVIPFLL